MELWSIVQRVLMIVCAVIGGMFAFVIGSGLLIALVCWVFFLLEYPLELAFWMLEKILPPFPRREERPHRREPEPPPPPPIYGGCHVETEESAP
ncbi:MAG: hypothetical protein IJT02_08200 [Synergistaceae bacterium]|nr:hypothetical protein [Synergistaceae bacterium]